MNRPVFTRPILLSLLIPLYNISFAQSPDTLWTKRWGTDRSYEEYDCVKAVPSGGYIATGFMWVYENQDYNWQVATVRLDDDGEEMWFNLEGFETTDAGHHIEPTVDGGFIQCGETQNGWQFDSFIRKLDAEGNQEWARVFGDQDSGDDWFTCVREVPAGGYITVGKQHPYFLYRISSTGSVIWRLEYVDFPAADWVEPTRDGGFIVPSSRNDGTSSKPYLYKVDASGEFLWDDFGSVIGDSLRGRNYCVREDGAGFLYTCGQITDGEQHRYVSKRNPDGTLIWSLIIPSVPDRDGICYELVILADGTVATAGFFSDDQFVWHPWLGKVSANGELLWEYEQSAGDLVSLTQGRDGSVVAAWWPRLSPLYDPEDMVLVKWESEIEVQLDAWTPVIPSSGGWLRYGAQVDNILLESVTFDAWVQVTGPYGGQVSLQQFPVNIVPGQTITRPQIYVWVPPFAPDGEYLYEVNVGVAPPDVPPGGSRGSRNMGLGSFTFTKGVVGSADPNHARAIDEERWQQTQPTNPFKQPVNPR